MKQKMIGNIRLAALTGTVIAGLTAGALETQAMLYQDVDYINQELTTVQGGLSSVSDTFDIRTAGPGSVTIRTGYAGEGTVYSDIGGFNPGGSQVLLSATASFYFRSASGQYDRFDIDLNSEDFIPSTAGGAQGATPHYIAIDNVNVGLVNFLNDNGYINYTVTAVNTTGYDSKFVLDYALLQVQTDPTTDPALPDAGSTSGMLGCAFLALAALKRQFKR